MRPARSTTVPSDLLQAPSTQAALALLLGNWRCAEALHRPAWDFACNLAQLRYVRLPDEVLETLIARGYVLHEPGASRSEGQSCSPAAASAPWSAHSRFVLTAEGVDLASQVAPPTRTDGVSGTSTKQVAGQALAGHEKPEWEPALGELRYRGQVVKQFHRSAPNQECILNAFQELGWPERVDDPLPKERGAGGLERLRETVKSLNRGQHVLHFRVEPDGRGVRWIALEDGGAHLPASPRSAP